MRQPTQRRIAARATSTLSSLVPIPTGIEPYVAFFVWAMVLGYYTQPFPATTAIDPYELAARPDAWVADVGARMLWLLSLLICGLATLVASGVLAYAIVSATSLSHRKHLCRLFIAVAVLIVLIASSYNFWHVDFALHPDPAVRVNSMQATLLDLVPADRPPPHGPGLASYAQSLSSAVWAAYLPLLFAACTVVLLCYRTHTTFADHRRLDSMLRMMLLVSPLTLADTVLLVYANYNWPAAATQSATGQLANTHIVAKGLRNTSTSTTELFFSFSLMSCYIPAIMLAHCRARQAATVLPHADARDPDDVSTILEQEHLWGRWAQRLRTSILILAPTLTSAASEPLSQLSNLFQEVS
jgi:hypothetical protein